MSRNRPDPEAIAELRRRDPALADAMDRTPPFPGFPDAARRGSHFHALARAIVYQQLATPAAAAIYRRVRELGPGSSFPTASACLAIPSESLRAAGLSRNKTLAIRDLARRVTSGDLRLRSIEHRSDEEVIRELTRVRGIGEWTAQMFLIFKLGRLDVMPAADLGVREGIRRLDGLDHRPEPQHVHQRTGAWRPLRSVGAWVCWRLLDAPS